MINKELQEVVPPINEEKINKMSRRTFLQLTSLTVGVLVLNACTTPPKEVEIDTNIGDQIPINDLRGYTSAVTQEVLSRYPNVAAGLVILNTDRIDPQNPFWVVVTPHRSTQQIQRLWVPRDHQKIWWMRSNYTVNGRPGYAIDVYTAEQKENYWIVSNRRSYTREGGRTVNIDLNRQQI